MTEALPTGAMLRVAAFGAAFVVLAVWEALRPVRQAPARRARWPINLGLALANTALVRLLLPAGLTATAVWAGDRGWGLLPALALPGWASAVVAIAALDFAVFAQHWSLHRVPLLWGLHRLHHTDRQFDVSTGVRFHPAEIGLSTVYKASVVLALGASPVATLGFELLLTLASLFSHANTRVPGDALVRRLVVTPDMHRVHHSTRRAEQDSNYGFCLSCWDRLFGTYRAQPHDPHETMTIGLDTAALPGARR